MPELNYHYDPVTGVYRGCSVAAADPLEHKLARDAVRDPMIQAGQSALGVARERALTAYNLALGEAGADPGALAAAAAIRDIALADAEAVFQTAQAAADAAAAEVIPPRWLTPAHAVNFAPPAFGFDEEAVFVGGEWMVRPLSDARVQDEEPEPDPLAEAQALALAVRRDRSNRIAQVRWVIDRHRDEVALGLTTTLVQGDYLAVLAYVQALRDVPEQDDFPTAVEWPALDPTLV